MATITLKEWSKYRDTLAKLCDKAGEELTYAVFNKNGYFGGVGLGAISRAELIDYVHALVTKYGEASGALACEMYDEIAQISKKDVSPAVMASTATRDEVGKAVNGSLLQSESGQLLSGVASRLVKQTAADTTLQNAKRDYAEFAWIPSGDTCPFCIALASRGWQKASKYVLNGNHAEHIHANCNCQFAIRFGDDGDVEGYDPSKYEDMYYDANGDLNAMRREQYAQNKDAINAQKRAAYAIRTGKETE